MSPPDRAWLHLRRSRHLGDPDDPHLLESHRSLLLRLAAQDGVIIPPENIITEVVSGEFLSQRLDFRTWLEDIERLPEGAGGVLYTVALDRLSRGPLSERARIQEALQRAAILVRTPGGTTDFNDPDQELLAEVRGSLARQELRRFKWRLAIKRTEKLRAGEILTGAVPFGYHWDKNTGQPTPNEQFPLLQACCRDVLSMSVKRLSERYGVSRSVLQRALHSPTICGWSAKRYTMAVSASGRRTSKPEPPARWVWAEKPGGWVAACTREEWELIQETLARRGSKKEWTKNQEEGWCRDVLTFVGAPAGGWVRLETAASIGVYAVVDPATKRRWEWVSRQTVHSAATTAILGVLGQPLLLAQAALASASDRERRLPGDDPAALARRLAELREQLERAVREGLRAIGEETRLAHFRVQRELEAEIQAVQRQLKATRGTGAPLDLAPFLATFSALSPDPAAAWERASGSLKRLLVNALIRELPVVIEPGAPYTRRRRLVKEPVWQEWVLPLIKNAP